MVSPLRSAQGDFQNEARLVLEITLSGPNRPTLTITHRLISRGKTAKLD